MTDPREDAPTSEPEALEFTSDNGSSRSKWVAGALIVALAGWMGSGYVLPSEDASPAATPPETARAATVTVRASQAERVAEVFIAEGRAMPDRDTMIRAEISGQIDETTVRKGADLAAGQVIARFDLGGREADLSRATAELKRAQRDFDNAETLLNRGATTGDRVEEARATLAAAAASVTVAEKALDNTIVRAPFAGRLEAFEIDVGEFISAGDEIGRIVDNAPLTIRIQIPQQTRSEIEVGQRATVEFITGSTAEGVVRFVGSSADSETRTFAAEVEVANENGAAPAGISAQVRIPTGEQTAHFVSPATLSLDVDGTLGVKTITPEDNVEFHEISIVRAETDGVWIAGLQDEARIITIGQGFVNDGERVDLRPEKTGGREAPAPEDGAARPAAGASGPVVTAKTEPAETEPAETEPAETGR